MFEAHVLHLLRRYLGEYVHGLSAEALRISVWKGDVVLKDLKLKAEALNSLKLPVTVKAGFVGTITLKVPWKSLGKEPVIVLIDRVFILAHPEADSRSRTEEDREKLYQAKLQQIEEAESATLEAISRSKLGNSSPGNSWLGSLISTIIGNLKISISNVHVRYEDCSSNPGRPFSCGITLAKLAAVTVDEQGNETFDTSGALDKLRKSLHLERLAVYHDSNRDPWKLDKRWENLSPKEWVEIFEDGISEFANGNTLKSAWSRDRNFLVSPINGVLKYHRLGNQERNDPNMPFEKASVDISDVSLAISEGQYYDWIRLMEVISRHKTYVETSHLRPVMPVSDNASMWWRYAAQAAVQQRKMCYRLSWGQVKYLCNLRRRYIQLYANSLQHSSKVEDSDIREIEMDLDPKVILLWRLLAHARVESVKSKEAAQQKLLRKKSWFSFKWGGGSDEVSGSDASEGSPTVEEKLTKEEWQAINKLLSYQSDEDVALHSGKEAQNMIRYMVDVSISRSAARIINIHDTEIACGTFENLHVCTKLKHQSTHCDVTLKFYGLSAPEGSLAQSVCSEQKVNALSASFVHCPVGENLDWRLSATISPCHVTVFMESYHRFLDFLKRSNAVSPTVALETATALQHKIEKVTRRAQEQFQMVLEEQSRFALDIDLDAPKVRVPIRNANSKCDSHLSLDFGHFTLRTKDGESCHDQGQSLYSRFFISGRDIAAFFSDCGSDNQDCSLACQPSISSGLHDENSLYSLIDRCGTAIIVDQIKVPHPSHPSTRVSIQVPTLGIHFSPSRHRRLMQLLNILDGTMQTSEQIIVQSSQINFAPWNPPDLSTEARILVWKGIGYSVAAWQPCFIALSGFHLYVLESETSQAYQRCTSMSGKQVLEVPKANVGGSLSCVAVCHRGVDAQKALESFSSLIIEFHNEEEKTVWIKKLVHATYQASSPPSVDIPGESSDDASEFAESNVKSVDLVVNGTLDETILSLYGKSGDMMDGELQESLILQVLAGGGKVFVSRCDTDLDVKLKLHSLKIKDELQGSLSSSPQYLACSFLTVQDSVPDSIPHGNDVVAMDEDDSFADALPDFILVPDSSELFVDEKDKLKAKSVSGDVFYEAKGFDESDFVSLIYTTRNPASPDYDGVDTQMSIRMSKLEFYCNRPTLVALIGFGLDLSSASENADDADGTSVTADETSVKLDKTEESENSFVTGLLGHGKGRVVFYLNMNVDNVTVFLNKEDGSQFAMLVQESFQLGIKVHPSSNTIEGTLGNLRLHDLSLGSNSWGLLCDIRNQGTESLVQFKFSSYGSSDDDYEGYDYSLDGRLSAVRIVFLYRFVQEITAYFMELATPHTEEVIKLVDKVGGIEWLIQKYEIDGASALKLDLSLETPLIIVPRNSMSKDFMQLDLGHLRITNEFSWHGDPEKDPSAVHLDILDAEILGMNLAIGIDGSVGKAMIREDKDIHIYVRRSLRDVFRKVPTFALEVKVGTLHTVMSHKEYAVILDCLNMNLNEQPSLPPSFRGHKSASKDTIRLLADKVNMNGQVLLSRTVTIIAVNVNYALLEVYHGVLEELPLARVALEGLWVSYRMTSLSEADLYLTVSKFSIIDNRPGTKPEMRLMLGSCADIAKQLSSESTIDTATSTMLVMDCRWRLSSQSFVVRVQQPRILVVLDFLLALCGFFVPSLGTFTGREEMMDPKNDPIVKSKSIVLLAPHYVQTEDVVKLSHNRQIVADAVGIKEFIYDGCGKTISLSDENCKELHSSGNWPIIIIGNGKRLRFMNVKIKNGSLLSTHIYLGSESSYSVFQEDGVEIMFLENRSTDNDSDHSGRIEGLPYTLHASHSGQTESCKLQSFSFETQIVSPELTFYDSSKSSLDDSTHGEKLLRAKMDLSFMYASKENDTWIRGLLKDLTLEAGSGLIILDPIDISGGYTSVKDKINLSLMSTDICVHLSLSVISLLLNLQGQAAAALEFGNADPLSPCTNFDRIWVFPKEIGRQGNLTFWRPQAPSNYVILGDCVTSRPNPPSQTVMAVNNTYGRVRKPLSFKLMGTFSGIQGSEGLDTNTLDCDCSLWLPIAPPGYLALGCVANGGSQPPPNHIVHCLRSDLVTSTMYSECMLTVASSASYLFGFSVWRMDNAFGSFYGHPSTSCPPSEECFDRNHLLRWFRSHKSSSSSQSVQDSTAGNENKVEPTSNESATSSGWEIVRSISKATTCYMSTPHFKRIWWDRGSDLRRPVSIWRPIPRPGHAVLGDCITEGLEPPPLGIIYKTDNLEISSKPVQFTLVAHIGMKGLDEAFFWYPIAPPGYASLGCVVTQNDVAPSLESFCCPRLDLVSQANILELPITKYSSSKASQCWSIWKVENQACTFLARSDLKKPSPRLAFTVGDTVKPKSKDNITAEMKIRYISLTILDSLCGMVTPLFDATITNLKLATHGRLEAMNAVLISSIAASTFNAQLEAWEPMVEPFEGIFKFETYDGYVSSLSRVGKRIRIAATSILNINLTAANIETLIQTITSWRKQRELEEKALKQIEEGNLHEGHGDDATLSALDEDDFQTLTIENKLGCDIFIKRVQETSDKIELLRHNSCASVWFPPPRYSDRLNVADESREPRRYIAVKIVKAKGLPVADDGNSHNFFCALRLVVESQELNQQKLFPQSARTKCVKPVIVRSDDVVEGTATWNELFIFEVPRKGSAKLEMEVTNLAAKAGKGEVVGASSFSVGPGASTLKKVSSVKMLHHAYDVQNISSFPLTKKGSESEVMNSDGCIFVSASYYEGKIVTNFETNLEGQSDVDREIGFWLGLDREGPWESFRSFLPHSVITRTLKDDPMAVDVIMKNGKKHGILRGLATVTNDLDKKLDISLCLDLTVQAHDTHAERNNSIVVEEVFQNQRYHPTSGWGNDSPGNNDNDQKRWSNRDFSYSSNDFFEPRLPRGWTWASPWTVDKSSFVDADGWVYGPDYASLKWPPNSAKSNSKSNLDYVRRRRWTRIRKDVENVDVSDIFSATVPGSATTLPWKSTSKNYNYCLQVRPCIDNLQTPCEWASPVTQGVTYAWAKDQPSVENIALARQNTVKQAKMSVSPLRLNQLEKKDLLFCCPFPGGKNFWLSVGTDASVLQTGLNNPVCDWNISVTSPLKLENRLPSATEFFIYEKVKDGNNIERQRGSIPSRGTVHIYYADLRNPIFLVMAVHGGWVMEKDAVLILDLSSNNHASSFWMVHRQRKRRLRVSIERDIGGTTASPKTIRFFVPYWISNDTSLALAYRVVEIEPLESTDADSHSLSRVKSAKLAMKATPASLLGRQFSSRKNVQLLEAIEDTSPIPSMLSPQDYIGRGGVMLFSSRNDNYLSPRVGISVACQLSENFSAGTSLLELEKKQRVDLKAFGSDGSYYKLSALLNMTSDRTKVVHFQPHTLFINRVGCSICLAQCDSQEIEWIHPFDSPKPFRWLSTTVELLKLRLDGYEWSAPFSVDSEGIMCIFLRSENKLGQIYLRVEVRSATKSSRYEVIFRPNFFSSSYRIENRSFSLPIRFRQIDGSSDSWKALLPNSSTSFSWEDLGRQKLLEVLVDGADSVTSKNYNIDEIFDHEPFQVPGKNMSALRVTVMKEEKTNVVKICDWKPENDPSATLSQLPSSMINVSEKNSQPLQSASSSECEFHLIVEVSELGLSIVDHTPEEIVYLSIQNLLLSYSTGLGSGISRLKIRMRGIQVDNQLPLTPMPVLFRPQRVGDEIDYILKFSVTQQSDGSLDLHVYPYIGFQGPENSAFLINIHEPIIWRIHGMIQQTNLSRLYYAQSTSVSVDPTIQIGVLNFSEVRFKVSMAMSPSQRPVGVLGFWSSLMTALGNTENMPVRVNQRFVENVCMRQSVLVANAISNVKKDLLSQPLQLLSGVDILGNASSALGHMSKGVAALSMDKKFIQSRQRQESKGVEDFGDVIREGGGAFAKGLFRGVTGILTKPLEGAKASGVEGFVQGVGKGIIGAAAQPVSGVLDLLSKTTEGANAVRMKIASAIASEDQLLRRRLPRAINGDNLLRPFDEYKSQGQAILQLAESVSFFSQVDLFKVRAKFALTDAYEDHFMLPKGRILVISHRRVILLAQPSYIIGHKKFNPSRDPCSVSWDVVWDDLATMELTHGKKDHPSAPPSRLVVYLQSRSLEAKDQVRVIKCNRDTNQAMEIYTSVEQVRSTYGPRRLQGSLKRKVSKPYSPGADSAASSEVFPSEGGGASSPQQVPTTFGSNDQ